LAELSEEQDVNIVVQGSQLHAVGFVYDKIILASEASSSEDWMAYARASGKRHIAETHWDVFSKAYKRRWMTKSEFWLSFISTLVAGTYPQPDTLDIDFIAFCKQHCDPVFYNLAIHDIALDARIDGHIHADPNRFRDTASRMAHNQRLFTTKKGLCGLASYALQQGDVVAMIFGCRMPLVLRPTSEKSCYKNVGWCYIDEVMDGEAAAAVFKHGRSRKRKIVLV
jgi:hypothetical protein